MSHAARLPRPEQPVDQGHQGPGTEDRTGYVEAPHPPGPALRNQAREQHQGHEGHRQVDQEDPAPGRETGQRTGDHQARRPAETGDTAPDAERPGPLPGTGEQQGDHRQRRRCAHGRPRTLDEPPGDELPRLLREPAEEARRTEKRYPCQENASAAQQIRHAPEQQQQAAERQEVGVDDPGQPRSTEAQVVADAGERDAHHVVVQDEHELYEAQHHQRRSPTRGSGSGVGAGGGRGGGRSGCHAGRPVVVSGCAGAGGARTGRGGSDPLARHITTLCTGRSGRYGLRGQLISRWGHRLGA